MALFTTRYGTQIVAIKILHRGSKPDEKSSLQSRFIREVNMMSRVQHHNLVKVSFFHLSSLLAPFYTPLNMFFCSSLEPATILLWLLLLSCSLACHCVNISPASALASSIFLLLLALPLTLPGPWTAYTPMESSTETSNLVLTYFRLLARSYVFTHFVLPWTQTHDTDNLLLTENHKSLKLADFGLAREETVTEMMTAETGTYRWMAPEVWPLCLCCCTWFTFLDTTLTLYIKPCMSSCHP